jgi:NAD(P)H-hydrate epimerase
MEHITHKEMQIIDINSAYFGVPREVLMENAGKSVVEVLKERLKIKDKKVLIFCGIGNNGGDGFVCARYLAKEGAKVRVVLLGKEDQIKTKEARKNLAMIKDKIKSIEGLNVDSDIIIDAILGTGIKGELREPVKSVVNKINKSNAFKVSIDVPSGLDTETGRGYCIKADLVVTFHGAKKGLEAFETVVKDIGVPKEAELYVGPGDVIVNLPKRKKGSHKGDNGKVLVVGGSELYYGAPVLAGLAVLNSGADLVYLAVPEINFNVTRVFSPDLIVRKYPGDYLNSKAIDQILDIAEDCDSLVIGPGLGLREETKEAIFKILEKTKIPVVIDADGIKALKDKPDILKRLNAVITPHPGEFKILTGEELPKDIEERKGIISKYAKKLQSVVLLKSPIDIIASPDGKAKLNPTGNAGMTGGGTGDVLAGLTASLIAQGLDIFNATSCAAFINGAAGDELYERKGYAFTASDLIDELPYTLKEILDFGSPSAPE